MHRAGADPGLGHRDLGVHLNNNRVGQEGPESSPPTEKTEKKTRLRTLCDAVPHSVCGGLLELQERREGQEETLFYPGLVSGLPASDR